MQVSPIQKYALRLLVVSGDIASNKVNWKHLDFQDAEKLLAPFGGSVKAAKDTIILSTKNINQSDDKQTEIKISRNLRHNNNLEME